MSHSSCMTEGSLTPEETVCVLDRLIELAEARPADWRFETGLLGTTGVAVLTAPDVRIMVHEDSPGVTSTLGCSLSIMAPVHLGLMHSKHNAPSKAAGDRVDRLWRLLHRARHAHRNAAVIDQLREKLGVDFSRISENLDADPELRTEPEVAKLRRLVAAVMERPALVGTSVGALVLAVGGFIAHAFAG